MPRVLIRGIGTVDPPILLRLEAMLMQRYTADVQILDAIKEPPDAFDVRREQYSSVTLLKALMEKTPDGEGKVLGVSERDLFIPMLTFVFGQAQLNGRYGLVSLARRFEVIFVRNNSVRCHPGRRNCASAISVSRDPSIRLQIWVPDLRRGAPASGMTRLVLGCN